MTGDQPAHHQHDTAAGSGSSGPDAPTVDSLIARVREAGGRITEARQRVLEVLLQAGAEHLSAEEIATRVHRSAPDVHLSTIYRTLESLADMGVLTEARLADGPASYHLASDRHHHAVCSSCGTVIDLPGATFAPVARKLAEDFGFVADPNHLTITGTCAACAAQAGTTS